MILTRFVQLDFKVLHLHILKSMEGYFCKLHSHVLTFTTFVQLDFTFPHQHNRKSLSTISMYTTLAQPEFYCIRTTWFQGSTLAQPDQMMYFTLHSHTLIFIITPSFPCFFILVICVCFLTSPYFVLLSKLSRDPKRSTLEQLFFLRSCQWLLPII